ncbi:hypothetical protein KFK09_023177 [Dendrobium nobile]|uniref:Uncharacterized protein n=1 Tax=Dendrobium nobile TaxID=94219 RepID=A0A8T3AKS9_DENNO|nr:hypothetical protein KFK09_023177 [Dendrobium nobile]
MEWLLLKFCTYLLRIKKVRFSSMNCFLYPPLLVQVVKSRLGKAQVPGSNPLELQYWAWSFYSFFKDAMASYRFAFCRTCKSNLFTVLANFVIAQNRSRQ